MTEKSCKNCLHSTNGGPTIKRDTGVCWTCRRLSNWKEKDCLTCRYEEEDFNHHVCCRCVEMDDFDLWVPKNGIFKAFLEGAAALVKLVFLINPNGLTKKNDVQKAPNGGFAVGRKDDVTGPGEVRLGMDKRRVSL
jgi:hypothetical protein